MVWVPRPSSSKTPHNCHQNRDFSRFYGSYRAAQPLLVCHILRFADTITVDLAGGTSTALLFVDPAAEYFADHFPGAPTLPGLVMLESAVRAAAALWDAEDADAADRTATLVHVERLQIVRRVVPGETLTVETVRESRPDADPESIIGDGNRGGTMTFTARGTVGGTTAMRARFRLRR